MKADTGNSKNFTWIQDLWYLKKLERIKDGTVAILPDSTIIQPSHKGYLDLPSSISSSAKESLVYPIITNESSLSIRKICVDSCIALFIKAALYIFKNENSHTRLQKQERRVVIRTLSVKITKFSSSLYIYYNSNKLHCPEGSDKSGLGKILTRMYFFCYNLYLSKKHQ